jgi:hypothetical protein
VSLGRGLADDLFEKISESGKEVQVQLVEVNQLRTPGTMNSIQNSIFKT